MRVIRTCKQYAPGRVRIDKAIHIFFLPASTAIGYPLAIAFPNTIRSGRTPKILEHPRAHAGIRSSLHRRSEGICTGRQAGEDLPGNPARGWTMPMFCRIGSVISAATGYRSQTNSTEAKSLKFTLCTSF